MDFPAAARHAISNTFYDKTIQVLGKETVRDSYGGARKVANVVKGTFKGNVRFSNLGEVQSDLGLSYAIDVAITCAADVAVAVDDLLEYGGVTYAATSVIPSDSHLTIVGTKWPVQ